MDSGDIIYFLLIAFGVVVSIISNINKAKKKRQSTTPVETYEQEELPYEEEEREIDVKSIFQEIIGQSQQPVEPPPPEPEPEPEPKPEAKPEAISSVEELEVKPFTRDSIEDQTQAQLHADHFKHRDEPDVYDLTLGDSESWEIKSARGPVIQFDLREAVIYDAIMNRPHAE